MATQKHGRGLHRYPPSAFERALMEERRLEIERAREDAIPVIVDGQMFQLVELPAGSSPPPAPREVRFRRKDAQLVREAQL